jgi:hypothetical protein
MRLGTICCSKFVASCILILFTISRAAQALTVTDLRQFAPLSTQGWFNAEGISSDGSVILSWFSVNWNFRDRS